MKIGLAISLCLTLLAATPAVAQTTVIPDGIKTAQETPGPEQKNVIADYFKTYASNMLAATNDPQVMSNLRAAMLQTFDRNAGAGFRAAAAEAFSADFAPAVFDESSPALVKVNAAIVAAALETPRAAELYASMTANPSAAVRYYGWKGFAKIAPGLLSGGPDRLAPMLNALTANGPAEREIQVVGAMAAACNLKIDSDVSISNAQAFRSAVLPVFTGIFQAKMQAIRDGRKDVCGAMTEAVVMLGTTFARAEQAAKLQAIQAMAEVLANSARAYLDQSGAAAGLANQPDSSLVLLVTECEMAINDLRGNNSRTITRAVSQMLKQPTPAGFNEVLLRVNEFVGGQGVAGELATMNVQPPVVLPPTPARPRTNTDQPGG